MEDLNQFDSNGIGPWLSITRKEGEYIHIKTIQGESILISVGKIGISQVRVKVCARKETRIWRVERVDQKTEMRKEDES